MLPLLMWCTVSTMPDAAKFMQTFQVTSPAKAFFTSLRRYPTMRGEVEVSMRGLRAALGQAYKAAHAICERLVKLKVHHTSAATVQPLGGPMFPYPRQQLLVNDA